MTRHLAVHICTATIVILAAAGGANAVISGPGNESCRLLWSNDVEGGSGAVAKSLATTQSSSSNYDSTLAEERAWHHFVKNSADLREPLALADLRSNSIFRDINTGDPLQVINSSVTVLVYGFIDSSILARWAEHDNSSIGGTYYLAISYLDSEGHQVYGATFSANLNLFRPDRYLVDGQVVPMRRLQKPPYHLTAEQTEKNRQEKLKDERRELEEKAKLQTQLEAKLAANEPGTNYLIDMLNSFWVRKLTDSSVKTMVLLTGSKNNPDMPKALALAKMAADKGTVVIFDADAPSAPLIAEVVGSRGIGITSVSVPPTAKLKDTQLVSIVNPYFRMKTLASAKDRRVMTPDSITGWGLMLLRAMDIVLDSDDTGFDTALAHWASKIPGISLGVRFHFKFGDVVNQSRPRKIFATLEVRQRLYATAAAEPIRMNPNQVIGELTKAELEKSLSYAQEMLSGTQALDEQTKGGAVVFGSGTMERDYDQLVFAVAKAIAESGRSIVTGGADGYMRLANFAAFEAKVPSIGIPMVGVKKEKKPATDVHTFTLPTTAYRTRIPLLFYLNDLVIVMPGGTGTLQEQATSFVNFASGLNQRQKIVFVSKDFYGELFEALKAAPLPDSILSRIYLVDSADEMRALLDHK